MLQLFLFGIDWDWLLILKREREITFLYKRVEVVLDLALLSASAHAFCVDLMTTDSTSNVKMEMRDSSCKESRNILQRTHL